MHAHASHGPTPRGAPPPRPLSHLAEACARLPLDAADATTFAGELCRALASELVGADVSAWRLDEEARLRPLAVEGLAPQRLAVLEGARWSEAERARAGAEPLLVGDAQRLGGGREGARASESLWCCPVRSASGSLHALVCAHVERGRAPDADESRRLVQAAGLLGTVLDLAEVRRGRLELESALRRILDLLPQCVFAKDEEGRFLFANRESARCFGLEPAQVVGRLQRELQPQTAELERMLADDRQVLSSGRPVHCPEGSFRCADGSERVFQTIKLPFRAADGRAAVLGVALDLTELRRAEAQRRELLERVARQRETLLELATNPSLLQGEVARAFPHLVRVAVRALPAARASLWLAEQEGLRLIAEHREPGEASREPLGAGEVLDLPLRLDGELAGLLRLQALGATRAWERTDLRFADELAEQAVRVLEQAARRRALEELEASEARLRRASAELEARNERLARLELERGLVEERERQRLVLDLHDGPGQLLALAQMRLARPRASAAEALLGEVSELLSSCAQGLRTLSFQLSPPVLHELGLPAALRWLADDLGRAWGVEFVLELGEGLDELDERTRVVLYRALRELMINVGKHAGVERALVRAGARDGELVAEVRDRGRGLAPGGSVTEGLGLTSIRERATSLGGRCSVEGSPGGGTTVVLRIPRRRGRE